MKKLLTLLLGLVVFSFMQGGPQAQSAQPGTEIRVRLLDRLDTGETQVGRAFSATLEEPVRLDAKTVLPKGTTVKGTVTDVVSSGRLKRPASITLQLAGLGSTAVRTEPLNIDGKPHAERDTALIGGGAAVGAILGGIAGGGKGAVIGTAVGAGAGTGTAYATGKQEIVLPSETELTFVIAGEAPSHGRSVPAETRGTASSYASNSDRLRDDSRDEQEQREEQNAYAGSAASSGGEQNFAVGISIGPPPPPRVVYVEQPPQPAPEFIWVAGYWYPVGNHYKWHEGYWTRPPYEGAHWVAPHHGGGQYFAGYWAGDRGRVEHDHDSDRDHDDHGHDHGHDHDH